MKRKSSFRGIVIRKLRRIVYQLLYWFDLSLGRRNNLVVLCYHSIADDTWRFSVSFKEFKKQIDFLLQAYQPITPDDLSYWLKGEKNLARPAFILTFDDGYQDIYQLKEYLKKRGVKPTLFLLTSPEKAARRELESKKSFLKPQEILDLAQAGWVIGCHSSTHLDFATLDEKKAAEEIILAKEKLEKQFGLKINHFAYPKGKYNRLVLETVKKGKYLLGFSMDNGLINFDTNSWRIPRVGIDRTHTFGEFQASFSPSVLKFKGLLMRSFLRPLFL